jgi:hypothetical protein
VLLLILRLHECADPAAAKSLHSIVDSVVEPPQSIADFVANSAVVGAAPTETS